MFNRDCRLGSNSWDRTMKVLPQIWIYNDTEYELYIPKMSGVWVKWDLPTESIQKEWYEIKWNWDKKLLDPQSTFFVSWLCSVVFPECIPHHSSLWPFLAKWSDPVRFCSMNLLAQVILFSTDFDSFLSLKFRNAFFKTHAQIRGNELQTLQVFGTLVSPMPSILYSDESWLDG